MGKCRREEPERYQCLASTCQEQRAYTQKAGVRSLITKRRQNDLATFSLITRTGNHDSVHGNTKSGIRTGASSWLNLLGRLHDGITQAGFAAAMVALASIILAFIYEVIARYFFNAPTEWANPLSHLRALCDDLPRDAGPDAAAIARRNIDFGPTGSAQKKRIS